MFLKDVPAEIDTRNCKQRLKYSTGKDKGSRRPIFKIKMDSLRGKIDLPFAVHDLSWVIRFSENRSKSDRIWSIFKCKRMMPLWSKNRSF